MSKDSLKQADLDHIDLHIEGLQLALEGAESEEEAAYIRQVIEGYCDDKKRGVISAECLVAMQGYLPGTFR